MLIPFTKYLPCNSRLATHHITWGPQPCRVDIKWNHRTHEDICRTGMSRTGWCLGIADCWNSKFRPWSHPPSGLLSSMCSPHGDTFLHVATSHIIGHLAQQLRERPRLGSHAISMPGRAVECPAVGLDQPWGLPPEPGGSPPHRPAKELDQGEQEKGQRSQHTHRAPLCHIAHQCIALVTFSQKSIFLLFEHKMNLFYFLKGHSQKTQLPQPSAVLIQGTQGHPWTSPHSSGRAGVVAQGVCWLLLNP